MAVVAVTLVFLYAVRAILLPFALALLISVLLDPTVRRLRMRGYRRMTAVTLVFVIFFGLLTVIGIRVAPIVTTQLVGFKDQLDTLTRQLTAENPHDNFFLSWNPVVRAQPTQRNDFVDRLFLENQALLERLGMPTTKRAFIEQYIEPQRKNIGEIVQRFFGTFIGLIASIASQLLLLLLTPVLVFMMLLDLDRFKARSATFIPPSIRQQTLRILGDIGDVFIRYLRGVTITIGCYIAMMAGLMSLLGAPYAVLMALLFGALYLIPYVGPAISAASLFLVTGLGTRTGSWLIPTHSNWSFALVLLLIFLVVHFTYDNLVYPRMVGKSVGLNPVVSMFVIFSGGALFGLVGMILAFPIAGSLKVIMDRMIRMMSAPDPTELGLPAVPFRHRNAVAKT